MAAPLSKKYLITSLIFHLALVLLLILSVDFAGPLPVLQNTNQHDVISAVVLGDTEKSKIVPNDTKPATPKPTPQPLPKVQPLAQQKDAIALKKVVKKKQQDLFAKDLLQDIKKVKQAKLKAEFAKTLHKQAEKSLRQQLLDETIKLKGKVSRQAQGEVNKYQALIVQAISEHWLVPGSANKKLTCVLLIRLAPGGAVLDVKVTKSSGDPALDSSARAAVIKASPLPVPTDPNAFAAFRQFALKVRPENVLASDG